MANLNPLSITSASQHELSLLVNDALVQQASQFQAIIGDLKTEITNLSGRLENSVSSKKKKTKPSPAKNPTANDARSRAASRATQPNSTPPSKPGLRRSSGPATPNRRSSGPATPSTPNSSTSTPRKRHPMQLTLQDLPQDFKTLKDALFVHVKVMWGLLQPNDVPPAPNPNLLKEFYARFSASEEIESALTDTSSADLIAQADVMTLRDARAGRQKIGRGLINLDETYILYIHGILAKVGIRVWGPDLNAAPDALFNSACRITAINTFRQLLSCGAYNYMNVNLKHTNSMSLLIQTYNHYVHYVIAEKYKMETKEGGRVKLANDKKKIQKNRERLRDGRLEFLLRNARNYPPRYRKVVEDVLAHSDDEEIPGKNVYIIKTLEYRSKNASKFFRRLDTEMAKEAQVKGKASRKRVRQLPKIPAKSTFTKAPSNMPIDYFDPAWFQKLSPDQKRLAADPKQVVFLPNAANSLLPDRHADEKLSDRAFSNKFLATLSKPYKSEDYNSDKGSDEEDAIDENGGVSSSDITSESEVDSELYAPGEYGDLYSDDEGLGADEGEGEWLGEEDTDEMEEV